MQGKKPLRSREERTHNLVSIEPYDNTSHATARNNPSVRNRVRLLPVPCHHHFHDHPFLVPLRFGRRDLGQVQVIHSDDMTPMPFEGESFLDHLTLERRLSDYTRRNYQQALERFFRWLKSDLGRNTKASEITKSDARSYLVEFQSKYSRRTLRNHVSGLRSFFRFCQTRGFCESNPFQNLTLRNQTSLSPSFSPKNKPENYSLNHRKNKTWPKDWTFLPHVT